MERTAFSLDRISKVFRTAKDAPRRALEGISISQQSGGFLCILGPTGCGKTTLLRLLAGLETPTGGTVRVFDSPPAPEDSRIGYVFQQAALFPWRTVAENVRFGLEIQGISSREADRIVQQCLEAVGLRDAARLRTYELSGGMQQRTAIARALAISPEILLMDEPFGAVDERTRLGLQDLITSLWKEERRTVVFVTHNIEEAVYLADRVIVMDTDPGRIAADLSVDLARPRDRLGEAFIAETVRVRNILERLLLEKRPERP